MQPITTKTPTPIRPTRTSVFWLAPLWMNFLNRSIVKMVEAAFSIEASELITAPRMAASMKPRRPVGIRCLMSSAKAESYLRPISAVCSTTRWSRGSDWFRVAIAARRVSLASLCASPASGVVSATAALKATIAVAFSGCSAAKSGLNRNATPRRPR